MVRQIIQLSNTTPYVIRCGIYGIVSANGIAFAIIQLYTVMILTHTVELYIGTDYSTVL